jgi:hypothetical protein
MVLGQAGIGWARWRTEDRAGRKAAGPQLRRAHPASWSRAWWSYSKRGLLDRVDIQA